ncbi:MAG TPA: hypothetical protein VNT75_27100 [Symbiobacteriaceae bacterium]|nr:hypothetical protein [Symbiobacteriaceae bacterium]
MNGDNERGYILITTIIALAVVSLLATAALGWATTGLRLSRKAVEAEQAFYLANAGIEDALARLLAQQPLTGFSRLLPVGSSLSGSYSVTFSPEPDQSVTVISTGVVAGSTRVVTARMVPGTTGGGNPGGGGPSGPAAPQNPPPGVPAHVFTQTVYSNGSLTFNNNSLVCGDLYAMGSVILGNNTRVAGSVGSGCASVNGTGKLVATGLAVIGNNTVVEGGWCDSTRWGAGTPCATKPTAAPLTFPDLSGQASSTVGGNLTLAGTRSYSGQIVQVNGDLYVDNKGAAISGSVTFYVKGRVSIDGSLTCAGTCSIAIVSEGDQVTTNNILIRSTLVTRGQLTLGNATTLYGNIQAGSVVSDSLNSGNGPTFYPLPLVVPTAPGTTSPPALTGWSS